MYRTIFGFIGLGSRATKLDEEKSKPWAEWGPLSGMKEAHFKTDEYNVDLR